MKQALFALVLVVPLLASCARPAEVRNLSAVVYPIAVQMKVSLQDRQSGFAEQRVMIEGRAANLRKATAESRKRSLDIQRVWRMSDDEARLRRFGILRENGEQILAAPLSSVIGQPSPNASNPPKVDQGPIDAVIKNAASLRSKRSWNLEELIEFAMNANADLRRIDLEKASSQNSPQADP
jgi:hypothetical protein